jgi:hypothetical protein
MTFTFNQEVRLKHIPNVAFQKTSLGHEVWLEDGFNIPVGGDFRLLDSMDLVGPGVDFKATVQRLAVDGRVLVHFGVTNTQTLFLVDAFALVHPSDLEAA